MWLRTAVAIIIVVGIGGLVVTERDSSPRSAASQLFVLPTDPQGLDLSRGELFTAPLDEGRPSPADGPVILIGTEIDGGFSDLVDVRVFDAIPAGFGDDQATEVDTPTGTALVSADGFPFHAVVQQRGENWLLLSGATGEQDLIDLISQVAIDPSGMPTIQSEQCTIIDEVGRDEVGRDSTSGVYSAFYNITDPTSGISFEVETVTGSSAALLGTYTSNPIRSTTVNGTAAWVLTRVESTGGINTAIVWRATPNRVIAIGAEAPLGDVQAMAERLLQVTEQDWLDALPGATITN